MVYLRREDRGVDVVVLVNKEVKRLALSEGSSSKLRLSGFSVPYQKSALPASVYGLLTLEVRDPHVRPRPSITTTEYKHDH